MLPYMTKKTADMIKNFEAGRLYEKVLKAITSEPIKRRQRRFDFRDRKGKSNVMMK